MTPATVSQEGPPTDILIPRGLSTSYVAQPSGYLSSLPPQAKRLWCNVHPQKVKTSLGSKSWIWVPWTCNSIESACLTTLKIKTNPSCKICLQHHAGIASRVGSQSCDWQPRCQFINWHKEIHSAHKSSCFRLQGLRRVLQHTYFTPHTRLLVLSFNFSGMRSFKTLKKTARRSRPLTGLR